MATDLRLLDIDIPAAISSKLEDLEIRSVRQLYARLQGEGHSLQDHLQLSDEEFAGLKSKIEDLIRDEYPEDMIPRIHPKVNKSGVAVHRLNDPSRPKFNRHGK